MKQLISTRTNHVWILCILMMSYSINSFAISDRRDHSNDALKVLQKDCVSCTPELAAGSPLEGNKSAQLVALVSSKAMSQEDASFLSYLDVYCMNFTQLGGVKNFKKTLLDPMKATAMGSDETVNRYWQTAYCEPRRIGGTKSPIVHLVAENPTDRKSYLVALLKYYNEKNDKATFVKILNSKNSRGQTLLDYVNYLYEKKDYIKDQEKPLNELAQFLCENGAEFSTYNKKCPLDYLSI